MPTTSDPVRLERLLAACRKGLHHDLPNQLIALAGLLQLFEADEAGGLSDDGRDYLRRINGTLQRTRELTRTLKDVARLGSNPPPPENVALAELVSEVLADLKPPPVSKCTWQAPRVWAPRAVLQVGLAQAVRLVLEQPATTAQS